MPREETFNWVDKVSIELTTQMLATLFDFPFEERSMLTYWSDLITADETSGLYESEERRAELLKCLEYFTGLWNQRVNTPGGNDLISMLAHGESTKNMEPMEYLGNLVLLIVGGNDTTRNSISGGVVALNQNPDQYQKLRNDPSLIPNMVSEIIRWQTPLAHMRRRALRRHRTARQADQERRQGRDVVRLRQPRRRRDPESGCVHDRSTESAPALVVRLRHSSLYGQSPRRDATARGVGRNPEALPHDRAGRRTVRVRSNFVAGYTHVPVKLHGR